MNYIKHLNGVFERMNQDQRLTSQHISLYMGIFQLWNINRFQNPVPVHRKELMTRSRIGGRNTYARCMKDLHRWGYISYSCTGNFHTGWTLHCIPFDGSSTTEGQLEIPGISSSSGIKSDTYTGLKNDIGTDSSGIKCDTDTGLNSDTNTGLKTDTCKPSVALEKTGPAEGPINKTNKINIKKKKKKKKSPKIFLIKREESAIINNPYHVENDKNYAEPL